MAELLTAPAQRIQGTCAEPVRTDAWEKLSGQAEYVEDIPVPPDIAFGAPLQSPYPHARIVSIDASRAARYPGVLGVLHRDNLNEFNVRLDREIVDEDWVRHYQGNAP